VFNLILFWSWLSEEAIISKLYSVHDTIIKYCEAIGVRWKLARGILSTWGKPGPVPLLSPQNSHIISLGINLRPHRRKPSTNRMSHGMNSLTCFFLVIPFYLQFVLVYLANCVNNVYNGM
jgi:hypothetical protein